MAETLHWLLLVRNATEDYGPNGFLFWTCY